MPCLTPEQIDQLARNSLDAATAAAIQAHLQECEACRRKVEQAREDEQLLDKLKDQPESAATKLPSARFVVPDGGLPSQIGPYRILRKIGAGAMGIVYEAQQDHPQRVVALKIIRPGFATPAQLRRFELEGQVLGRLQHPGIAQIFEAGTAKAKTGPQPYFVMELVRGRSLTEYARERGLNVRQRLELVAQICDAVEHAHQKGVIHRDLKPGNILVTEDGQPKILDFGVARATDADLQATTLHTDIGQLIGTLPYMSPEQVGGDPNELDTRSDVYALGIVLYELLAGRLPHNLKNRMVHEAVRVIREEEPTRLSSINKTLRGDIETIVGRALMKEKDRRYPSATALAADIRHYLQGEPIETKRDNLWYLLCKALRRHRVAAMVALLVVAGSIAAALVASAGWRQASQTSAHLREAVEQRDFALTLLPLDRLDMLARQHRVDGDVAAAERCERLSQEMRATRSAPGGAATLQVSLYRGELAQSVGIVGLTALSAQYDDDARVHVKLPQPAYCYLIALNPDGTVQSCWPTDEATPPPSTDDLVFPPADQRYFGLTDGVGLQAFVLLASQEPLPPYGQWKSRLGSLPWERTESEGVWQYDGQQVAMRGVQRGVVRERSGPPKPFVAVCDHLRAIPGVSAVQAIAFPVEPTKLPRLKPDEANGDTPAP